MKHIVNFSGGKDSTAMLLKMIEKDMPIDEIIFCDTGKEFPEMYEHIEKVEKYINIPITKLKGYSWPGTKIRWCTTKLKTQMIEQYLRKYKGEEIIHYIGIALDEPKRIKDKKYPLVDFKVTEKECLEYCYSKGFNWNGLYEKFDRLSCWCCPFKSLKELRILRKEYPDLWEQLKEMDKHTYRKFRPDYTVEELEEKFTKEES